MQETRDNLARKEKEIEFESKRVLGEQTVKEIKMRRVALNSRVGVNPTSMPDGQILFLSKGLHQFDAEPVKAWKKSPNTPGM